MRYRRDHDLFTGIRAGEGSQRLPDADRAPQVAFGHLVGREPVFAEPVLEISR